MVFLGTIIDSIDSISQVRAWDMRERSLAIGGVIQSRDFAPPHLGFPEGA